MSEMYCILCHGRGLDQHDHTCGRCKGTGYEPETFETGRGPAGCHALNNNLLSQTESARHHSRSAQRNASQDAPQLW